METPRTFKNSFELFYIAASYCFNYLYFNHIIARNLALLHFVTNHGLILLYCNYCDCNPWKPPWPLLKNPFFANFSRDYLEIIVFVNIVRWWKWKKKSNRYSFNPYASFKSKLFWFDFDPLQVTPNRNDIIRISAPGGSLKL